MKRLLIVSALLAFAFPAQGEEIATCEDYADFAKTVMESRQNGLDMVEVMKVVNASGLKTLETITLEAYSMQRFDLPEDKKRAIADFRNEIYRQCYSDTRAK